MPIENLLTKIIVNTNKLPYEKQKLLLQITQDWLAQAASGNQDVSHINTTLSESVNLQQVTPSVSHIHSSWEPQSSSSDNVPMSEDQQGQINSSSNLIPATKEDLVVNIIEERAYERKPLSIPIDFVSSGQLYKEVTKDLSAGGLFIKTKKQNKFKKNQKISMVFVLSEDKKPFKLTGKVMRIDNEGIAVQFHNISPFECVAIEEGLNNQF